MSGQSGAPRTVQQYVKGEASTNEYEFSSISPTVEEPEALVNTTELPLTEKTELAEEIQRGEVTPTPTLQQRRFSVDWDPIQ